jgi:hypothetical protein
LAVDRLDRRIDRSEHERAEEMNALEAMADNVARQRVEIDDDVRKFGQPSPF